MAEFKGINGGSQIDHDRVDLMRAIDDGRFRPLFPSRGDISDGGLGVSESGRIFDVSPPSWDAFDRPVAERANPTRLRLRGDELSYTQPTVSVYRPTYGSEREFCVSDDTGMPYPILPDGTNLIFPDGATQPISNLGVQPEALMSMVETGTKVHQALNGVRQDELSTAKRLTDTLADYDLAAPPVSMIPGEITRGDISEHPYIQLVTEPGKMPYAEEFIGTMSLQTHTRYLSPDLGAAALTHYQAVQAVTSIVTQAAVVRDGQPGQSLGGHFLENPSPTYVMPPGAQELMDRYGKSAVPADWREIARTQGSPSGGGYVEPFEMDFRDTLARADKMLRQGQIPSVARVQGLHTDRLRLEHDRNTMEASNMGTAGGNHYKTAAASELVAKYLIATQLELTSSTPGLPITGADDDRDSRLMACQMGLLNSERAAMYGKNALLHAPDGSIRRTPSELLTDMLTFTDRYPATRVSRRSAAELLATLSPPYIRREFAGMKAVDVYQSFYTPESPLTAAEAIELALRVEPQLPYTGSLLVMAGVHREHLARLSKRPRRSK